MKIFKQEMVFWVVHGGGGQVRKLRFSIGRLVVGSLIGLSILGGLLFVAGDYIRMQWHGMKQAWHLETVAEQRDSLINNNEALQSKLEQLLVSQDESDDFRREIKKRLVELSRVLRSVPSPDLASARDFVRTDSTLSKSGSLEFKSGPSKGVGGAEVKEKKQPERSSKAGVGGAEIPVRKFSGLGRADPKIFEEGEVYSDEMVYHLQQLLTLMRITPMGRPVAGELSSDFGFRWSPFEAGMLSRHEGTDFSAKRGTPIMATADGIVTDVSTDRTYGLKVDITHHPELLTRFGHMMASNVRRGQIVRRGEVIGYVGSTGRSTGPHLHYEVRFRGKAVDPMSYLQLHQRLVKALQ